jgi:hypothetical protein
MIDGNYGANVTKNINVKSEVIEGYSNYSIILRNFSKLHSRLVLSCIDGNV